MGGEHSEVGLPTQRSARDPRIRDLPAYLEQTVRHLNERHLLLLIPRTRQGALGDTLALLTLLAAGLSLLLLDLLCVSACNAGVSPRAMTAYWRRLALGLLGCAALLLRCLWLSWAA
jgi:hypothetical protein